VTTSRKNLVAIPKVAAPSRRKVPRALLANTIEVSINSKFELVEEISSLTKSITEKIEFDEDTAGWIDLAVREAVINAIRHGNKGVENKKVDVKFVIEPDGLTIYVRDRGEGFDASKLPDPLDPNNLLNPNGRGIFFMRTFMDEVEHSLHPEGGSLVRLYKRRKL
jgi:serine/threonine-protein kinase RsbW